MIRTRLRRFAALAAGLVLIPLAALAGDGLAYVPPEAVTVGVAHVAQFRSSPLAGKLFLQTDQMTVDGEGAKFLAELGLDPAEDIDVVTFALAPKQGDATDGQVLLILEGRFDSERITSFLAERGAEQKTIANGTYFLVADKDDEGDGDRPAVAIVSRSLIFAGSEPLVAQALGYARGTASSFVAASGLARELSHIEPAASAWVLVDVPRTSRLDRQPDWQGEQDHPGHALVQSVKKISTVALWTTDKGEELSFGITALSSDAETRQLLEDAARGALATWRLAASEKDPALVSMIRQFKVKQNDGGVSLTGSISGETLRKFTARHKHEL